MGFGPSGPRVIPALPERQGFAQFAEGLENVLSAAKEQRDFTKAAEEFDTLLKKHTKDGTTKYDLLGQDVLASRNIPVKQKKQYLDFIESQQKRTLEKEKLDFEKEKSKNKPALTLFQRLTLLNKQEENRIKDVRPSDPLGLMSEKEREKIQERVNAIRGEFDKKRNKVISSAGGKPSFDISNPEHLQIRDEALQMTEGDQEAAEQLLLEIFDI